MGGAAGAGLVTMTFGQVRVAKAEQLVSTGRQVRAACAAWHFHCSDAVLPGPPRSILRCCRSASPSPLSFFRFCVGAYAKCWQIRVWLAEAYFRRRHGKDTTDAGALIFKPMTTFDFAANRSV